MRAVHIVAQYGEQRMLIRSEVRQRTAIALVRRLRAPQRAGACRVSIMMERVCGMYAFRPAPMR